MRTASHIRNIQRIERGERQPGIMLALRLVAATDANAGEFFALLASSLAPQAHTTTMGENVSHALPKYEKVQIEGVKCLFGPLLHQVRLAASLSQAEMAQKVQYNLRNMGAVEKGIQEPGVMVALSMVMATGTDVKTFFNTLYEMASSRRATNRIPPNRLES